MGIVHEEMMKDSEEHPENYPEDYKTRVLNLIAGLIAANVEVANAPTIEAEWIPCSERLPEKSEWYIVTVNVEDESVVYLRWYSELHGWEWNGQNNTIAWMPLPKPYREESEVEE